MLQNHPFVGNFPVAQSFGDHPELYQALESNGIPLRGHNGMDFALPLGTPVLAVRQGVVLQAHEDPARFGNFVLIGHEWGQSLYAHLASSTVQVGQSVNGGQPIGLSGNSGLSATPHLHFGLRILPYSVTDGWCGFSDPQPYLTRLTKARGAIIGPHLIGGVHRHLDLLHRWQPRLVLVLDPNPDEMHMLRQACPETVIIGRIFELDSQVEHRIRTDPQAAARWAHEKVLARYSPAVNYWQLANEVLQDGNDLDLLNQFELARMALAETEPSGRTYRCAILAFSVGRPDLPEADRMAMWRRVYPALERAEQQGHVVAVHQYGKPDLWGPARDWYIYRLEHQVLRRLPFKRLQFAVTEYGIDGLIDGGVTQGWQGFATAEAYVDQLLRSGAYLERFSGRVLGYAVFTLGHTAPWGSYDIAGPVTQLLAERSARGVWSQVNSDGGGIIAGESDHSLDPGGHLAGEPTDGSGSTDEDGPDGNEPPDGDGDDAPVDVDPVIPTIAVRLGEWVEPFNLTVKRIHERPDQPSGEVVYLLKDLFTTRDGSWDPANTPGAVSQWAREAYLKPLGSPNYFDDAGADHHLFAAVIGLDGNLIPNAEIRFWSDGFEKLGDPAYTGYVTQRTKQHSGWANVVLFGSSSYVPERGERGPWCWAPVGAAEVVSGGGMPAKQHVSMFAVWQAVKVPPPVALEHKAFLPFTARGTHPLQNPAAVAQARRVAWERLGFELRPDSPIAAYARAQGLGMPVTEEVALDEILVQGFSGGIVYADRNDSQAIYHTSW